ncbi:MAG: hypothetical protein V4667_06215 [Bacteroidota bacterium]
MKSLLIITITALFFNATPPTEQSKKFCDCLKAADAKKTEQEKNTAKKKCLELDEKLREEFGEDKTTKQAYVKECETCMSAISDAKYGIAFSETKTYQEKIDDVCGCFTKATKANDMSYKMQCSKLQSRYAKTFEVDSVKRNFNKTINLNCQ